MQNLYSKLTRQFNRKNYRSLLLYFLAALVINFVVELLARRSLFDTVSFFLVKPWTFLYGTLVVFFTLSFSLLFRKRRFYFFLLSAVWLGLAITDFILLTYRSMPLTASDIWLMASVRDIFEKYLNHWQLFLLIAAIAALIGGVLLLWVREKKFPSVFGFALLHTLLIGLALTLFTNLFIRLDVLDDHTEFSNLPRAYHDNGFVYGFSASLLTGGVDQPTEYSPSEVEEILDTQRELPPTRADTPNIIFVQLESFFDVNYLKNLTFAENPVPNFQAIRAQYSSGLLSVPCIGAGTANTEFEVLTGMNLSHFGVGEYPYMTIVSADAVESLAFTLSDLGYSTHAVHNNNATFYDRNLVYANLGFQSFTSLEYMNGVVYNPRGWAKDAVLTDEIMKCLSATDGKDLVFTVSVQPHGKYPDLPLPDAPVISVSGVEDEERKNGIEYYLGQLRECDAFIADLTQAVSQFDEPTVIVFYGDHLPSFNFQPEELSRGDTQTTEYVLWSNFYMKRETLDLQAYQLSAYVLDRCGIREGTLFRLHQSYSYAPEQKDSPYQEALEVLEYDAIYGEHYSEDAPLHPAEMRFGIDDAAITALDFDTEQELLTVHGAHFTPFSVVYVNDIAYPTEFLAEDLLRVEDIALSADDEIYIAQVSAADEITVLNTSKLFIFQS